MCLMKQNAVLIYIYYTVMRRIIKKTKKKTMIFIYLYEESEKNPVQLVSAEK